MAEEFSRVVIEAAASRTLVEKLLVNDETHIDSFHPAVVLAFVLEPVIQFRKLALVEVSPRDANAIHIAASLIEGPVGQRAPEIDANEVLSEYGGEIGGHHLKKVGQILRDILGQVRSEERRVGKECRSRWSPYH